MKYFEHGYIGTYQTLEVKLLKACESGFPNSDGKLPRPWLIGSWMVTHPSTCIKETQALVHAIRSGIYGL